MDTHVIFQIHFFYATIYPEVNYRLWMDVVLNCSLCCCFCWPTKKVHSFRIVLRLDTRSNSTLDISYCKWKISSKEKRKRTVSKDCIFTLRIELDCRLRDFRLRILWSSVSHNDFSNKLLQFFSNFDVFKQNYANRMHRSLKHQVIINDIEVEMTCCFNSKLIQGTRIIWMICLLFKQLLIEDKILSRAWF